MNLRYKVWAHLRKKPDSAISTSAVLGIEHSHCCHVMRWLRESGYITYSHRVGRDSYYMITGTPFPKDPKAHVPKLTPGASRPKKKSYAAVPGYGSGGKIALEEAWPISTRCS